MDEKFFLKLLSVSSAHAEMSRAAFLSLELTEGQPKILYILKRRDGHVQKELANLCGIRQSTLTVLLSKMEEQQLIYRDVCYVSGNKRAFRIFLTEKGKEVAEKLEQTVDKMEEKCFTGFNEEEKKQLLRMLERVEINIKNDAISIDCN